MKKLVMIFAVVTMILAVGGVAKATVIDFDAVALRPANDGSGEYGTITEYVNGNGVTVQTLKAGQKVYYGTEDFDGWAVNRINYIDFTYEKTGTSGSNPYINMVIHDTSNNYGIISSQGGQVLSEVTAGGTTTKQMRYYFAGNSGNQPYGFRFYEPSPDAGSWAHGTNIAWADISSWSLLDVGVSRPLYSGEALSPRGPRDHGLSIMWGDSQSNYIGDREIYNVTVNADNNVNYVSSSVPASVPEPSTILLLGMGLLGLVGFARKKRGYAVPAK